MSLHRFSTFDSLGLRDYRLLWLGQLFTSMGAWMDQVARTWLIYDITHSPLQLGLIGATRGIPVLVFGTLAGVMADRSDRKTQLIVAQMVNMVLNVILAFLVLTGRVEVWHIYVTGFLAGTVQAFQQPARQVLISDLVPETRLLNAVSLSSAAMNVSRSIGPAFCGLVIQHFGVSVAYFLQAGLFFLASVWTFQMRVPAISSSRLSGEEERRPSLFASAREGIAYIAKNRLILALMILGLAPIVLGMPFMSLMPIFAIDVFGGGASEQGFMMTAMGVGALLGALTMASLGRRQASGKLLIIAAMGFGAALVVFSQSPVLIMAILFTGLAGLFHVSYTSQNQTIIQMTVPRELRGRVLGIYLLDRGLVPLGSLLAGTLATFLGGPWAVTVMGSSCVVLAAVLGISVRDLWRLRLMPREQL